VATALPQKRRVRLSVAPLPNLYARVYAKRGARELARLAAIFALSKTETGRLFCVSRQAVDEWYTKGVPVGRIADVGRTADLAKAFHEQFQAERIPQIVRAPLPGLDDQSVLAVIRARGTVPVMEMLDRAFSFIPRS